MDVYIFILFIYIVYNIFYVLYIFTCIIYTLYSDFVSPLLLLMWLSHGPFCLSLMFCTFLVYLYGESIFLYLFIFLPKALKGSLENIQRLLLKI